ncbi:Lrp/AsnC family transcriptional regulator [Pseudomonas sp. EYE_354]|uniref:Lrp/AsnC family transcriptional regulator n=1 Tax=Pseudomonas sp. EYE_354 TaxID=2853449 RepID=UPI0020061234|nr:Lrp/AsnC family transcriptional regulator [Pseudomonas sp. EYE_354]MCK6191185.1 Lrp/AsnC family transcriptional regulator [Pseudomonas sp. EYE_354]
MIEQQASLARIREVAARVGVPYKLDELDVALLRSLVADARMSQRQLAVALGISAPTVSERMSRLERAGVITGYSVQINWGLVGYTQTVYLSITAVAGHDLADIMCRLWGMPEVQEVTLITGDLDLLVRLKVRDHEHLRNLLMDHIWQIAGLQGTSTQISMAEMPAKRFADGLLEQIEQLFGQTGI